MSRAVSPWSLLALARALCASAPRGAEAAPPAPPPAVRQDVPIPDVLRPWIGWVLHGHEEEAQCPTLTDDEDGRRCAWPTALTLTLGTGGGTFAGRFRVFRRTFVTLPGDDK